MSARSVKSSSICSARPDRRRPDPAPGPIGRRPGRRPEALTAFLLLVLLSALPAAAKKKKVRDADELFNPLLGVEHSHWLVGPIRLIATEDEIEAYLLVASDDDARAFIDEFWAGRAEGVGVFEKKPREVFDQRVENADKRFSEGTYPGHLTDRGSIFVVFGEPESIEFESGKHVGDPPIETWRYPKDAAAGLGGDRPDKVYRFVEIEDQVVFYNQLRIDQVRRRRPPSPNRF